MKPVIAVDIDEVLGAFVYSLSKWHNRVYGTNYTENCFFTYSFSELPGFGDKATSIQKVNEFFKSEEFVNIPPLPGAREILESHKGNFRFIVVTARNSAIEKETRAWLDRHYPNCFEDYYFAGSYDPTQRRTKGEICREIGAICLIDDNVHYAVEASTAVGTSILFGEYAWNTSKRPEYVHPNIPSNVVRIGTWNHVDLIWRRLKNLFTANPAVAPRLELSKNLYLRSVLHERLNADVSSGGDSPVRTPVVLPDSGTVCSDTLNTVLSILRDHLDVHESLTVKYMDQEGQTDCELFPRDHLFALLRAVFYEMTKSGDVMSLDRYLDEMSDVDWDEITILRSPVYLTTRIANFE